MGFGDIIRKARKGRLSQQALGEQIGVWGTYIGQIEKGERIPSDERCLQLAKVLALDAKKLLIVAYQERAQVKEARSLFKQMEQLLTDPVWNRLLGNRELLDAELLEALENPSLRRALKNGGWRQAVAAGVGMPDRDIPTLIQIIGRMTAQQWEALLTTAKAMAGIS